MHWNWHFGDDSAPSCHSMYLILGKIIYDVGEVNMCWRCQPLVILDPLVEEMERYKRNYFPSLRNNSAIPVEVPRVQWGHLKIRKQKMEKHFESGVTKLVFYYGFLLKYVVLRTILRESFPE